MPEKSPLAPMQFPNMLAVAGVRLAVCASGQRYEGRNDLLLVALAPNTSVAGVFTRSSMPSAPVILGRESLAKGGNAAEAQALVVNAGNANAFTGKAGLAAAREVAAAAAELAGCGPDEVYMASTGVIGEPFLARPITSALPGLHAELATGGWREAAEAIHTTDTFAKAAGRVALIDGQQVVINGIAKGSGMIQPDMATMLAFIFTNAAIPAPVLREILEDTNTRSFNSITVDGDTSTSDTVLAFATGEGARHEPVMDAGDPRLRDFCARFEEVMVELAQLVVRDGEGATKFITVTVDGAASDEAAKRAALTIANSPLLKTAIAGGDANWGRVVMALGRSGVEADPDKLVIRMGGQQVTRDGARHPDYDEAQAAGHLKGQEIDLAVDLGLGSGHARIWTCDLTHGYISINADYRS